MANVVCYTSIFLKQFKKYSKKYVSLKKDFEQLEKKLIENPKLGTDMGNGLYKIRLAIKSKNKGKSGGFRVITYLLTEEKDDNLINLVLLYDKSETPDIPKKQLQEIVKQIFQ